MPEEKKSKYAYERKSVWLNMNDTEKNLTFEFAEDYKTFISQSKTERECYTNFEKEAISLGFKDLKDSKPKPGEKIIFRNGNKNLILAVIGKSPLEEGFNLIASHMDSPRLDLKPLPVIEDTDMAFLKTHYYGGIKKYQWVNMPLALHGVVVRRDGSSVEIVIGENDTDPVFTINDILPHLAGKIQGEKKLLEGIEGEQLKILIGNMPVKDKDIQEKVKEMALQKLFEAYQITEEDFISSEFEIVPAYKARDIGFDKSMIGAYGHDDRVCSYSAFRGIVDLKTIPEKTALTFLVEKEEIGSFGVTGIRSKFLTNCVGDLLSLYNPNYSEATLRKALSQSFALSGDVGAVINPVFKDVFDSTNSPKMGFGILIDKYTGSRGKSGASDASAELMGKIRKLFNDNNIIWQPSVLGKVDEGGGGTVALYLADLGIQVVDCGVGVDGMHSPFEVISKADLHQTYLAYSVFLAKS